LRDDVSSIGNFKSEGEPGCPHNARVGAAQGNRLLAPIPIPRVPVWGKSSAAVRRPGIGAWRRRRRRSRNGDAQRENIASRGFCIQPVMWPH
jgi:hypothetical protein